MTDFRLSSLAALELRQRRFVGNFANSDADSSLLDEFLVCFWHEEATREENTLSSRRASSLSSPLPLPTNDDPPPR